MSNEDGIVVMYQRSVGKPRPPRGKVKDLATLCVTIMLYVMTI